MVAGGVDLADREVHRVCDVDGAGPGRGDGARPAEQRDGVPDLPPHRLRPRRDTQVKKRFKKKSNQWQRERVLKYFEVVLF